jgi:DNA-binding response OmpR family regulator
VEDEALVARDIEQTLSAAGVRVLGPAASVHSALALIGAERPDAAILDLDLRGEGVTPVARRLKELKVPFILSTACDNLQRGKDDTFAGVPHLGKPMPPNRCVQMLGDLLA